MTGDANNDDAVAFRRAYSQACGFCILITLGLVILCWSIYENAAYDEYPTSAPTTTMAPTTTSNDVRDDDDDDSTNWWGVAIVVAFICPELSIVALLLCCQSFCDFDLPEPGAARRTNRTVATDNETTPSSSPSSANTGAFDGNV